jgi:hypothetical protein
MSESTNVPEHKLRQDAKATLVTTASGEGNTARGRPTIRAWPFNPEDASPRARWRLLPSDLLRDAEALLVRTTLDKINVLSGDSAFTAAMRGDAATAIAVALSLMPIEETTLRVDIAMTGVLRGARGGNAEAALVLAHVVGRAELGHPFATELSASLLAHHLRHSLNRRRLAKEEARLWSVLRAQDGTTVATKEDRA